MSVNPKEIYKRENNIFQSESWLELQKDFGREIIDFDEFSGYEVNLPFGRKAVLVQKAPKKLSGVSFQASDLPTGTVFVRLEPMTKDGPLSEARLVTKKSLLSGQASPKATRILDLSKSESELLSEMKPKTRYNIRLAEKKGVTVEKTDNVDILYKMLEATSQKGGGYFPHQKTYYENLIKHLYKENFVHIFVAKYQNQPLAAILVCFFGETSIYLHGGQGDQMRNLMAPYLCQWEAIKYAKKEGYKYYDFWGVAETDDPNDPWAGISRFKEGFGGEKIIFPGSFDLVTSPFWYNILTIAARFKHLLRR